MTHTHKQGKERKQSNIVNRFHWKLRFHFDKYLHKHYSLVSHKPFTVFVCEESDDSLIDYHMYSDVSVKHVLWP